MRYKSIDFMANLRINYNFFLIILAKPVIPLYTFNRKRECTPFGAAGGKGWHPSPPCICGLAHIHNSFRYTTRLLYDDLQVSASITHRCVIGCVALIDCVSRLGRCGASETAERTGRSHSGFAHGYITVSKRKRKPVKFRLKAQRKPVLPQVKFCCVCLVIHSIFRFREKGSPGLLGNSSGDRVLCWNGGNRVETGENSTKVCLSKHRQFHIYLVPIVLRYAEVTACRFI